MHRTYELYLHHRHGDREFVALTCRHTDVLSRAGEVLRASEAVRVEICEAGQHFFTLEREPG